MNKTTRGYAVAGAVVVAIGVGGPLMAIASPSYQNLLITILLTAYWATAWNILGGLAGQLSIMHATFVGTGAYTSSILFVHFGVNPWLGMLLGATLAALLGLFVGYLCFRYGLREAYFALTTMAFGEAAYLLVINSDYKGIFGGQGGVRFPVTDPSPLIYQFPDKMGYYYVIAGLLAIAVGLTWWMRRSKVGYYLIAIRENERSAQAAGINITRYKLVAITVSAFLTALGGTFYAQYYLYIDPTSTVHLNVSVSTFLPAIVGGMDTVFGPLVGSILLVPLSESIRNLLSGGRGGGHLVVYGLVLILVMRFIPQGLLGWVVERRGFESRPAASGEDRQERPIGGVVGDADPTG